MAEEKDWLADTALGRIQRRLDSIEEASIPCHPPNPIHPEDTTVHQATAIVAIAAAALLAAGCTTAPPAAPVEGEAYLVRHATWPQGQEMPVVYRAGRFRPI
jgi:hypothetical protein